MKKIYLPLVAIAILLALAVTVAAAPRPKNIFNGSVSDRWSNASNWSLNRVPATGDSIVIPTGQSAYVGNSQSNGPTSTLTIPLNNVIIIVQSGGILQMGNGSDSHAGNTYFYYGVLALDNASVVSLEKAGSPSGGQITASPAVSNNQITIGGNLKFGGNLNYSSVNGGSTGLVKGPARATINTGTNAQGFSLGSLPVVLVGFNANLTTDNKVNIEWTTQQEISTDHFEIQRSNDGYTWQVLATVKASGFSSIPKNYSCSDASPQKGINLYRMRMVDFDGNYGFSDVVNVRLNALGKISLFPNPSVNSVTVSLSEAPVADWSVSIVNSSGQVVLQKKFSKDMSTVNLSVGSYPTGNYTVEINSGAFSQNAKLMIAH